jgi:transposase InsO family protein
MDTKRHARFVRPGHTITGDRTRSSRGAGWEWVHTIVDDCSRLAYAEAHRDERADTVVAFTERALDFFLERGIVAERLLTDNHFSYTKSRKLRELLERRGVEHWTTRPYTPRTNGKVERLQQTMDHEWARGLAYRSSADRRAALPHWLAHPNRARHHSALGNRPPLARVREVLGHDI